MTLPTTTWVALGLGALALGVIVVPGHLAGPDPAGAVAASAGGCAGDRRC